jgi:hypothetical protein
MNEDLVIMNLALDSSDDELLDAMRVMKRSREQKAEGHIVLTILGFDEDQREVWQIPEVQRYCHRLVEIGFVSFLDTSTSLPWNAVELHAVIGGLEVWLIGEGKFHNSIEITEQLARQFDEVISASNARAEKLVGAPSIPLGQQ